MPELPTVTILLPVYNEADHIEGCVRSLRAQDYTNVTEILVASAPSDDGTDALLRDLTPGEPPLTVVPNPDRFQSLGVNRLIPMARGEITVRVDAHTDYAPDYVRRCVEAIVASGAEMVGGPMRPVGTTRFERAVAAAMSSPWAVGPSGFRRRDTIGEVDTVYLGAFPTDVLRRLGGYRHFPSGVAEDADLAYRLRKTGGRIVQDPAIRSSYRPRSSIRSLSRQFRRYGRGKAEMFWVNGEFPSWRPLAPLALILAIITSLIVGVATGSWWPPAVLIGGWLGTLHVLFIGEVWRAPLTVMAAAAMQISYGVGLARGLLGGRSFAVDLPTMGGVIPAGPPPAQDLDR